MSELPKPNINTSTVKMKANFQVAHSVDCVIFGYDGGILKVLLIESVKWHCQAF